MATEFSYEHVFRATSPTAVIASYFEPGHLAAQDKVAELVERAVIEDVDDGAIRRAAWHVRAAKPLPLFVRPFVSGGRLAYREEMTWRRADDAVDLTVTPELLGGRVSITAVYQLTRVGEMQVKRRYAGSINVKISLVSGKVERGILAEFEKSMAAMAQVTQTWLEAHPTGVA